MHRYVVQYVEVSEGKREKVEEASYPEDWPFNKFLDNDYFRLDRYFRSTQIELESQEALAKLCRIR